VRKLVKKILAAEKAKGRIDVSFVDDDEIRRLNKQFRRKNKPTDVLSFNYDAGKIIGDVIISRETTEKNAKKFGVTLKEEVKRLVIHGTLHVLGYDHGRQMRHAEEVYSQF